MSEAFVGTRTRTRARAVVDVPVADVAAAALGGLVVAGTAVASGGYFPTTWGWAALVLSGATCLAVVVRKRVELAALDVVFLAAVALLVGWIWASALWSDAAPRAYLLGERGLVYVAGVACVLVVTRRRSVRALLGGLVAGISLVSTYALATRLFPDFRGTYDPIATNRLEVPLGYWNALGIFAVIGALLAVGFAARGRLAATRASAAAALVVLLPTVYFTFGRGAIIAFCAGLLAMVALDRRRLQLLAAMLATLPAPAVALWFCSHAHALTRQAAAASAATAEGRRIAFSLFILAALAAWSASAFGAAEESVRVKTKIRRTFAGALALALVLAISAAVVRFGSPVSMVRDGYRAFTAPPVRIDPGTNLNKRLFSLSGSGRIDLWRAAWDDYRSHPWLGSGAGTYEGYWLEHRPTAMKVKNAHNLYFEQLAELGPVGLGLLVLALAVPLVAAVKARRHPLATAAFGAYVAYLVHAAADWDWEMPAVTLAALFCGGALVVLARGERRPRQLRRVGRSAGVAAAAALAAVAFVGWIGNSALAAGDDALGAGNLRQAEAQARKAMTWAPWSPQPWRLLAEAQYDRGDLVASRHNLETALRKDPGDWQLWLDFAAASNGAARTRALAHTVALDPRSPEIAGFRRGERRTR